MAGISEMPAYSRPIRQAQLVPRRLFPPAGHPTGDTVESPMFICLLEPSDRTIRSTGLREVPYLFLPG